MERFNFCLEFDLMDPCYKNKVWLWHHAMLVAGRSLGQFPHASLHACKQNNQNYSLLQYLIGRFVKNLTLFYSVVYHSLHYTIVWGML